VWRYSCALGGRDRHHQDSSLERRGDTLRIDFYCGRRALLDYRWKNDAVNNLAGTMSIKDQDLREAVERSLAQGRENFRLLEETRQKLMDLEARTLIAGTPVSSGLRLINRVFDDRSAEEARRLAMALTTTRPRLCSSACAPLIAPA